MLAAAIVAAVGTAVLGVFAIVTAWYARKAFVNQAEEVRLLQLQAQHDQWDYARDSRQRRRERAALVYLTTTFHPSVQRGPGDDQIVDARIGREATVGVRVHNTGNQPVYDVRIHWVDAGKGSQAGGEDALGTLPPQGAGRAERVLPDGTVPDQFVPVVYFRDAAGLRWTLLTDGELEEVDPALPAGAPAIATTVVARALAAARPSAAGGRQQPT